MYRIERIKTQIKDCVEGREEAMRDRAGIIYQMKTDEKRCRQMIPELDRANQFKGKEMDSSVMHGQPQRFLTVELRRDLKLEISRVQQELFAKKRKVTTRGENRHCEVFDSRTAPRTIQTH